jgi:hypothetical protein
MCETHSTVCYVFALVPRLVISNIVFWKPKPEVGGEAFASKTVSTPPQTPIFSAFPNLLQSEATGKGKKKMRTQGDGLRVFDALNDLWKNRPHARRRSLLNRCRGKIVNVRPRTIKR